MHKEKYVAVKVKEFNGGILLPLKFCTSQPHGSSPWWVTELDTFVVNWSLIGAEMEKA